MIELHQEDMMEKFSALCIIPGNGSVWLDECYWEDTPEGRYVIGETWDSSGVGSPHISADFMGEVIAMNFPESCVLKVEDGRQ